MKKRLVSLLLLFSLSGVSPLVLAGLSIAALATIAAGVMAVAGVVVASPGILTGAVFMGGAGLICLTTSFCDSSSVNGLPSAAPSGSPGSASSVSPHSLGPNEPRSGIAACAAGAPYIGSPGSHINCDAAFYLAASASGSFYCADGSSAYDVANGSYVVDNVRYPGDCSAHPFVNDPQDGLKVSNSSASSPSLELPSVSSLPADAVEMWPGIYASPSTNVLYDMRNSDGSSAGTAQTSQTINADGSSRTVIEVVGTSGTTNESKMAIDSLPDGSRVVTVTRTVPVTDSQGNPDYLKSAVVTEYSPAGSPVVSTTFGNGATNNGTPLSSGTVGVAPSSGGDGSTIGVSGTDTGTGTGTGTTGTGTGSCASGDCSTESTQLANKGLLQSLLDFFTGTSTAPDAPSSRSLSEVKGSGLDNSFLGLRGWTLPPHSSQCPTSSFSWNGNTYEFNAHCQLISDHFAAFRGVMTLIFSVSALFVVLKA